MTRKEAEALAYIASRLKDGGVAPTIEEVSRALGQKSKSGGYRVCNGLRTKGHITWVPGTARSIRLVSQLEPLVDRLLDSAELDQNPNFLVVPKALMDELRSVRGA